MAPPLRGDHRSMTTHTFIRTGSAALAATAFAFLTPVTGFAAPREWDIGSYDSCVANVDNLWVSGALTREQYGSKMRGCCEGSGGIWNANPGGGGTCVAPPKDPQATVQPSRRPTEQIPSVIQTFTPTP